MPKGLIENVVNQSHAGVLMILECIVEIAKQSF